MYLGVDYYPEQWEEFRMEEDMDTIREMGGNVIRIAEFAWHRMEPEEGRYDFSYFDRVIAMARKKGLYVVMGTPTATIPAWLAKKHPEILSSFEGGRRRAYGGRHVACFNSPVMYEYTEKIIRQMAGHYRGESQIVAWQLDNEIGHEGSDLCYCPSCRRAFHRFLEEKYHHRIDLLNQTYGTVFWSQEYNDFEEIPLPEETITTHNPSLRLDWERFRNVTLCRFLDFQKRLLREIIPGVRILHDFCGGGFDKHVDFSHVAQSLDIVAYNNYPVWGGQKEPLAPHEIAFGLDYIRGLKQKNFWITEAIMGAQGHDVTGFSPRPYQAILWSCQAMAHGCESLMYFRYRGATKGAEQFCYGILDADNVKGRKFREVRKFFTDVAPYGEALAAPIRSQVAIVYDYDSLASFRIQRQSLTLHVPTEMQKLYRPFYEANVSVDVVPASADFSDYRVILLPQMIITTPAMRRKVRQFAEAGGTVILTYRSSVKDENNNLLFGERLPVGYTDFAGVCVEETESLQETDAFPLKGEGEFAGSCGRGGIFRDMLTATKARILYRYGDPFYEQYAAVTRNDWGRGTVYYLGCGLDEATTAGLMHAVMKEQGIRAVITPDGVEVAERGDEGQRIRILLNHNPYEVAVEDTVLPPFAYRIVDITA